MTGRARRDHHHPAEPADAFEAADDPTPQDIEKLKERIEVLIYERAISFEIERRRFAEAGALLEQWVRTTIKDWACVRAVRIAMQIDVQLARRLADTCSCRFPRAPSLEQLGALLRPPAVVGTAARRPDPTADWAWIEANAPRYRGRWVALSGGSLLADADSLGALLDRLTPEQRKGRPYVTRLAP
jgi:hypothetical protein